MLASIFSSTKQVFSHTKNLIYSKHPQVQQLAPYILFFQMMDRLFYTLQICMLCFFDTRKATALSEWCPTKKS